MSTATEADLRAEVQLQLTLRLQAQRRVKHLEELLAQRDLQIASLQQAGATVMAEVKRLKARYEPS
jgi:hypothetical protein